MTHMSLFSGIGGIDLAAEMAGFTTVGQCEIDGYATKVLEKNFPNVERWRDIHDVTAESFRGRTGIGRGELTLLSGGFPCQPHSVAGKRKASADERDLWGEFARVIREIRPKWVLGENVRGLLSSENGRFFGRVLRDLDEMGYNVGWCCYGASEVGAIHKRERVFIIAWNANGDKAGAVKEVFRGTNAEPCGIRSVAYSDKELGGTWDWIHGKHKGEIQRGNQESNFGFALSNTAGEQQQGLLSRHSQTENEQTRPSERRENRERLKVRDEVFTALSEWNPEQTKPLICRDDDGFSGAMDRLKCLGNAVVPAQVYPILEAIKEIELCES